MAEAGARKQEDFVRRVALAVLACCLLISLAACSEQPREEAGTIAGHRTGRLLQPSKMLFGMFLDYSGLGDRGYMDMQYKGLVSGCQKHGAGFVLEQRQESSPEASERLLETLVANDCKAVFCTSYSMKQPMMVVAERHPEVLFILMDNTLDTYLPNTASATFRVGQAAYLAGFLAANMSETRSLGVIAGTDAPPIREFVQGFSAGVEMAGKDVSLQTRYIDHVDPGFNPWNNPAVAVRIAREMAEQEQVDVFFPVAGASGLGVFQYVKDIGKYAIGVDSDQDHLAQGHILTSVMKRLDVAVETLVGEIAHGRFENRNYLYELGNGGVSLSPMKYTRGRIPRQVLERMAELEAAIVSGAITVPSAMAR
ncbi:BMP family lipoprotein [Salidesulfovibrio onnuriiensis]|uniref:BMP family lipoprotein n=1 Tax=Salidesulfovibrio onnuriiensis TaxID=2583823 RepID=UPI0011CBC03D|nr:BMP family ABC transporter substrate-binding protein [Salidesulfovibrio onnuriiensis]